MGDIQSEIAKLVEQFAADISALAREMAVSTLTGALDGLGNGHARRAPAARSSGARAKGGKRAADEIEKDMEKVSAFIKDNPGRRIEQINAALGTTTKDLALPLRKLIASDAVKTAGVRRGTQYFPGSGASNRSAKKARKGKKRNP